MLIVDKLRCAVMTLQIEILYGNNENGGLAMRLDGYGLFVKDKPAMIRFYRDVLGFEIKEDENTSNVYLLKDGTLFYFKEETILKSAQAKNMSIHKRPLTFAPDIDKS